MANDKLNGSVDLLAQALRGVFTEAVEQVGGDIKAEINRYGCNGTAALRIKSQGALIPRPNAPGHIR